MKIIEFESIILKVGENAFENTKLVRESSPNFWWIHLKSFPSGHVVIECDAPSKLVVSEALNVCLMGTKYKHLKDIHFSITKISNLKCTEKLGEVEFVSNKKVKTVKL